jgi:hypothetical protein
MKSSWVIDVNKFNGVVKTKALLLAEAKAKRIYQNVIDYSPVRTGQFRASWRMAVNKLDSTVIFGGSPLAPLSKPAIPEIKLTSYKDKIHISNSHKYAKYIELGSPTINPVGVLRKSILKG